MGDMELLPMCGARGTGPNKPNTEDAALQGDYRSQGNNPNFDYPSTSLT